MSIKELLIQAPVLCSADNTEKHVTVAKLVWGAEESGLAFQRQSGETAIERIAFLFDWPCKDEGKRDYCKRLAGLVIAAHYVVEHDAPDETVLVNDLAMELGKEEAQYPDVASILSVDMARQGYWF